MAVKNKVTQKQEKIYLRVFKNALVTAVIRGNLDPTGMTDDEFRGEIAKFLKPFIRTDFNLLFHDDYKQSLLSLARSNCKDNNYLMSALMYATWTEHLLNEIISVKLIRRKFNENEMAKVIRDSPLRAKMDWLLKILGIPPIYKPHQNRIERIADIRNKFVHYKWKAIEFDKEDESDKDEIAGFEKTVRYLQRYKAKYIELGARKKIHGVLRGFG